jgi:putative ABC transport system permease protein
VDITHPLSLVVRTTSDPAALTSAVRQALRAIDPDLPISSAQTMQDHMGGVIATERFSAVLMSVFALIGLGLAALGLYAVVAYSVTQRTGEIGLRMALGSPRRDVLAMVLREGALLVCCGLAAGVGGAQLLTRLFAGILYGVSPTDTATFAVVTATLALVGLTASLVPAWRATRIDPVVALRHE